MATSTLCVQATNAKLEQVPNAARFPGDHEGATCCSVMWLVSEAEVCASFEEQGGQGLPRWYL